MNNVFVFNSLNIFALAMLLLIYAHTKIHFKKSKTEYISAWEKIIWFLIITIMLDSSCWFVNEQTGAFFYYLGYILNVALFTVITIFTTKFALFIKSSAEPNYNKKVFSSISWGLVGLNFLLSFLSVFFGFIFKIDPVTNAYSRGDYYFVMVIILLFPLIYELFDLFTKRKTNLDKIIQNNIPLIVLMAFDIFLSMLFLILQGMQLIDISLLFPTNALCVLYLHLMIVTKTISRDYLSGLQNRLGLERYFARLPKTIPQYLAVIYIDLNNFKQINDTFGHEAGDEAIKAFSDIIINEIKMKDLATRIGGDEFVLVSQVKELEHAEKIAQAILRETNKFNASHPDQFHLEFSYGISYAKPNEMINKQKLLEEADKKMYDQKNVIHQKIKTTKAE